MYIKCRHRHNFFTVIHSSAKFGMSMRVVYFPLIIHKVYSSVDNIHSSNHHYGYKQHLNTSALRSSVVTSQKILIAKSI